MRKRRNSTGAWCRPSPKPRPSCRSPKRRGPPMPPRRNRRRPPTSRRQDDDATALRHRPAVEPDVRAPGRRSRRRLVDRPPDLHAPDRRPGDPRHRLAGAGPQLRAGPTPRRADGARGARPPLRRGGDLGRGIQRAPAHPRRRTSARRLTASVPSESHPRARQLPGNNRGGR